MLSLIIISCGFYTLLGREIVWNGTRERVEDEMGESIGGQGCKKKEGQGEARRDNYMKGIV